VWVLHGVGDWAEGHGLKGLEWCMWLWVLRRACVY